MSSVAQIESEPLAPEAGTPYRTPAKGKRERPCDGCRRRKGRCVPVEGQIQCAACAVHQQECTYVEDPKPRKRKTEFDSLVASTKKKAQTYPPVKNSLSQAMDDMDLGAAPSQAVSSILDSIPVNTMATSEHQSYIGPTAELEPVLLRLSPTKSDARHESIRSLGGDTFVVDRSVAFKAPSMSMATVLQKTIEPQVAKIAKVYQRCVHGSLPILDDSMLARLQTGDMSGYDPLVIAAMLLAVMPWFEQESSPGTLTLQGKAKLEGMTFSLFTQTLYQPTLNTVQAGLLLMQYPQVDTKALHTQLAAVTHELGLHLDCADWGLDDGVRALRRRLAWAVYVQDKWCAVIHGRPSAISNSNWSVQALTDADWTPHVLLVDETRPDKLQRQELFVELVRLTGLLDQILHLFYSVRAMKDVDRAGNFALRAVLEKAKEVQIPLKAWFARLPDSLKMSGATGPSIADSGVDGEKLEQRRQEVPRANTAIGFLHLAYYTTEITLHRSIIRRQPESPLDEATVTDIVRTAAKERLVSALEFANRLRPSQLGSASKVPSTTSPSGGNYSCWYFASRACFAIIGSFGALLAATSPAEEEASFYRARLKEYRWTLGVAAKHAPGLTQHAADLVDEQLAVLEATPTKPAARELWEMRREADVELVTEKKMEGGGSASGARTGRGSALSQGMSLGAEEYELDEEVIEDSEEDEEDEDEYGDGDRD